MAANNGSGQAGCPGWVAQWKEIRKLRSSALPSECQWSLIDSWMVAGWRESPWPRPEVTWAGAYQWAGILADFQPGHAAVALPLHTPRGTADIFDLDSPFSTHLTSPRPRPSSSWTVQISRRPSPAADPPSAPGLCHRSRARS